MKKLLIGLLVTSSLFSCSKDEASASKVLVLVKKIDMEIYEEEVVKNSIRFEYEGNKITKLYDNEILVAEFKFDGEKPIEYKLLGEKPRTNTITYDKDNLKYYTIVEELERTEYVYNNNVLQKTIGATSSDGKKWNSFDETVFEFENSNLTKETYQYLYGSSSPSSVVYSYDDKPNPFVNLNRYQRILLDGFFYDFKAISNNNTLKRTNNVGQIDYKIIYSSNGFPSQITAIDNKTKKALMKLVLGY